MADKITKLEEVLDYRIYVPRKIKLLRKEYFKTHPNTLKNEPQAYFERFWVLIFPELGFSASTISAAEQELGVKFPEIFRFCLQYFGEDFDWLFRFYGDKHGLHPKEYAENRTSVIGNLEEEGWDFDFDANLIIPFDCFSDMDFDGGAVCYKRF